VADFTDNIFLAIHARDLTGPGLLGASASLHSFATIGAGALAGVVGGSLALSTHFQQMTQTIANNTTMSQGDLTQMRQSMLRLGFDSNASLDQLGEGYRHALNLGFNFHDAQRIVEAGMRSGISTGSNLGDTINTLAGVMHAYNIPASQTNDVMDRLHLAAAQGNTTLEEFTTGGSRAMAMAANLGVPLNQVLSTLSALTRHESLRDANTQMVGFMSKLANPTAGAKKALAQLSLSSGIDLLGDFTPAGIKAKGLTGVLADLKAATHGNVGQMFQLVPALRGGMAAMLLTGNAGGDYASILRSISGVTAQNSVTTKAYAATQHTAAFALGELRNRVEILGIKLGTALMPYVAQAATWIGSRLPAAFAVLQKHLPATVAFVTSLAQHFIGIAKAITGILGPIARMGAGLLGVGRHSTTTSNNMAHLADVVSRAITAYLLFRAATMAWTVVTQAAAFAMGAWRAALLAGEIVTTLMTGEVFSMRSAEIAGMITTKASTVARWASTAASWAASIASKAWAAGQWILNAALAANPIGLVVLAIAALVAGFVLAYQHVKWFHDLVNSLWKFLKDNLGPVLGTIAHVALAAVKAQVDLVVGAVTTFWGWGVKLYTMLGSPFKGALTTAATTLRTVFGAALDAISHTVSGLISSLQKLFGLIHQGQGVKVDTGAASQLRLAKKDEGGFASGLAKRFGGTGTGTAYWDYAMLTKGVSTYWTSFVKQHRDVATQYLALLKSEGNKAAVATISGLLGASGRTPSGPPKATILLPGRSDRTAPTKAGRRSPDDKHVLSAAAWAAAEALMAGKPRRGVVGGHDYNADLRNELVRYRGDQSRFSTNPLNAAFQRALRTDIANIGRTERAGRLTDTTYALTQALDAAVYKAEHRPPKKGVVGSHDYNADLRNELVRYQGDRSRFSTNPLNAAFQRALRTDIANIGKTERAGHLTDTTYALNQGLDAAIYKAQHHKPKRGVVGSHDYAADESRDLNTYGTDLTLFKAGLLPETKILSDIAAVAKDEKAGHLTDRASRMSADLRAYDQRQAHHNTVVAQRTAHHNTVVAQHKEARSKRTAIHQATVDLGTRLSTALTSFHADVRAKDVKDAATLIPSIVSLVYDQVLAKTHSAALATAAANAERRTLTVDLSPKSATTLARIVAPRVGNAARSVYGYSTRSRVGEGVSFGEDVVTFGGGARRTDVLDQLRAQVAVLTSANAALQIQNATLSSMLDVGIATRDATVRVGDKLGSLAGGGRVNPMRSSGLATAIR
jgi:TP901 family phage tail tape measure protein